MKCRVLRPFSGPEGVKFQIGERVDTTDWKNREQLIAQRYIQPARLSSGFEKKTDEAKETEFRPSPPMVRSAKIKKHRRVLEDIEA